MKGDVVVEGCKRKHYVYCVYCMVFTAITHMVVVLPAPLWPRNDVICPS